MGAPLDTGWFGDMTGDYEVDCPANAIRRLRDMAKYIPTLDDCADQLAAVYFPKTRHDARGQS